ncbi:hypothetical protein BB561_004555 [Smittium simulii]|uniref:Mitochondrial import inner membrane translocase subunit TIM50 n=1 Tax=Smittium simulii TaxID=133385 RepID=A0A2T9YFK8_9FUNG|nr:hypothetical protein BB561_004555 [Smittium simulii]
MPDLNLDCIQGPILLVLGLNGALVDKNYRRGVITERPGLKIFIDFVVSNFDVMIWSSCQRQNVSRIVSQVFGFKSKDLLATWSRADCILDGDYDSKCSSEKPLYKIWDSESLSVSSSFNKKTNSGNINRSSDNLYKWGPHNTIIIDDALDKACHNIENHICVDDFDLKKNRRMLYADNELTVLTSYLKDLLKYKDSFNSNLSNKSYSLDSDYKFYPDLNNSQGSVLNNISNSTSNSSRTNQEIDTNQFDVRDFLAKNKYKTFKAQNESLF